MRFQRGTNPHSNSGRHIASALNVAGALGLMVLLGACGSNAAVSPRPTLSGTSAGDASPATDLSAGLHSLAGPGQVTSDPLLPRAIPLTPEVLEGAGRGWVLATYSPTYFDPLADYSPTATVEVVYLISPQGERFQVLELESETPYEILLWTPGETHAVVRDQSGTQSPWLTLELLTGEMEPFTPSVPLGADPAGTTATGERLWFTSVWDGEIVTDTLYVTDSEGRLLNTIVPSGRITFREDETATGNISPDGQQIAWAVADDLTVAGLMDGVSTDVVMDVPGDKDCRLSGWLDDTRVLVLCMVPDETYELGPAERAAMFYEVNIHTGATSERSFPWTGCEVFSGFGVGSTLVGQVDCMTPSGAPGDDTGIYTFDGTTFASIPELEPLASGAGTGGGGYLSRDDIEGDVLYGRFGGLSNDGGSSLVFRWDASTHSVTILIPAQAENPVGNRWILKDVLSVLVGW